MTGYILDEIQKIVDITETQIKELQEKTEQDKKQEMTGITEAQIKELQEKNRTNK